MFRLHPERTRRARPTLSAVPVPSYFDLCALCVSALSYPSLSLFNFKVLALSMVEGSTFNVPSPNSHRIIFFAHPHPLTPIESYSCKKQGGGGPHPDRLASLFHCLVTSALTRRNARNSNPFMGLLHNSRTPQGGRARIPPAESQNFSARSTYRCVCTFPPEHLAMRRVAKIESLLCVLPQEPHCIRPRTHRHCFLRFHIFKIAAFRHQHGRDILFQRHRYRHQKMSRPHFDMRRISARKDRAASWPQLVMPGHKEIRTGIFQSKANRKLVPAGLHACRTRPPAYFTIHRTHRKRFRWPRCIQPNPHVLTRRHTWQQNPPCQNESRTLHCAHPFLAAAANKLRATPAASPPFPRSR